jgi:hypothetical protein
VVAVPEEDLMRELYWISQHFRVLSRSLFSPSQRIAGTTVEGTIKEAVTPKAAIPEEDPVVAVTEEDPVVAVTEEDPVVVTPE